MRIVVDYRPALRTRSGVGEYVHQVCRALTAAHPSSPLTLFTSSLKDRPSSSLSGECRGARIIDRRLPVSLLNYAWHNLEWPPIEFLTRDQYDVSFSPHPLMLPTRRAAQVVMIHDLDFLRAPHRTTREIRRDYPRLAREHAQRADGIVVPSHHTASDVVDTLGVPREKVAVCPPGAPEWTASGHRRLAMNGYVLFVGTLEPRKNVGRLLEAYGKLLSRRPDIPKLLIAGQATADAQRWLATMRERRFGGRVEYLGYVADADRPALFAGARVLVLPSLHEGFGMPVLEAMSLGIPVIVSRRAALPELVGDAGVLIEPDDDDQIAAALERVLLDDALASRLGALAREQAAEYCWHRTATGVHAAFAAAVDAQRTKRNRALGHSVDRVQGHEQAVEQRQQ